jgi:RNA ligase (TIGR02306 family)
MRKLAAVREILAIEPIENADRLELVTVLGWKVVVKKGEFSVGDKVVYFEIDSILPEKEWSEFLRPRKFKIKTIKLRGQVSQGLVLKLEDLGIPEDTPTDSDVTKLLGVTKQEERTKQNPRELKEKLSLIKRLYYFFNPQQTEKWPSFVPKTDETRVQNFPNILYITRSKNLYETEKLDGQSYTAFFHRGKRASFLSRGLFGVCSRNIWLKTEKPNNWWDVTEKFQIKEALENYCRANNQSLAIQGEIVGPNIQGNRYGLKELDLFIFNIIDLDERRYLNYSEKKTVLEDLGLKPVPFLSSDMSSGDVDYWLDRAEGPSLLNKDVHREGIVVRSILDDSFSFKAISNKFLLES